ncbi:hypothetical protein VTH06DRAFT_8355 [Thermothelomyces fergusii]
MPAPPPPHLAQPQSAPRQRTSIACRYCRKRKIRCSGYTTTSNGKCTNCDKLRIDCIFQPVSTNASAAFVPVSAVPGGVPPGTPLYGAYGQPLPPHPPNHPVDDDPRRRSPASMSSSGTPPAAQSSPGRSMPPQPKVQPNQMSLDNLVIPGPRAVVNDIDRNMLGRLNRRS